MKMKGFFCTLISMKKPTNYLTLLMSFFVLIGCTSVDRYNNFIQTPLGVQAMQEDVNYVQRNLLKMHPSLYLYVSENQLNFKFDSLRATIRQPLLPNEFQLALAPVLAEVRQGHMTLMPLMAKLNLKGKDKARYQNSRGPFSQLGFHWQNNTLYLSKNNTLDSSLLVGSQVLAVEGIAPSSLFEKYRRTFTSDGFNTTFIDKAFERLLPRYYQLELGYRDSIRIRFSHADHIYERTILRQFDEEITASKRIVPNVKPAYASKKKSDKRSNWKKYRRIFGYNISTKKISKQLSFPIAGDSNIALLKVRDFSYGRAKTAYRLLFGTLNNAHTQHLILDLRGNLGGKLADVSELYSYLVDDDRYQFVQPAAITSRFYLPFYEMKMLPVWSYGFLSPVIIPHAIFSWTKCFSKNGVSYSHLTGSKMEKSKIDRYQGELVVLVDGGTFSAGSLLAANLKGSKRATLIGEETGGAASGTVAGYLPVLKLPNSHLRWRFGLMEVKPYYGFANDGRGVLPDISLSLSAEEMMDSKDLSIEWVLKHMEEQTDNH